MIDPFSSWLRWNHTRRPLAERRDGEIRIIPGFRRPSALAGFSVPSIPFFFLPLALLLLLMFYQRKSHGLHYHELRGFGQNDTRLTAESTRRTHVFDILTRNVHLTQESVKGRILPLVTPSSPIARPAPLGITTLFGQGMDSPASDSNRDKPVPDLSHDNTPVGPSLSLGSNSG